ncbi:unnamed protein product, partial [Darwinula stevensoni]
MEEGVTSEARRMAWRSHGKDNADMVAKLQSNGIIRDERIVKAMLAVDRKHYSKYNPYIDSPQGMFLM